MSFLEVFEVKMEVNDLQSGSDLNFRVELPKIDLCANFYLPSYSRDFKHAGYKFSVQIVTERPPPLIKHLDFIALHPDFRVLSSQGGAL